MLRTFQQLQKLQGCKPNQETKANATPTFNNIHQRWLFFNICFQKASNDYKRSVLLYDCTNSPIFKKFRKKLDFFNIHKMQCSQPFQPGTVPVALKCWIMFKYHTILHSCNPINIFRFQNYIPRQRYPLSLGRMAEKCSNNWSWFS